MLHQHLKVHDMRRWYRGKWVLVGVATLCGQRCLSSGLLAASAEEGQKSWLQTLFQRTIGGQGAYKSELPKEAIAAALRKREYTYATDGEGHGKAVLWYETNHINANTPIEDRHSESYLPESDSYFFAVYDGHSGWHCSESLRKRMPQYMAKALSKSGSGYVKQLSIGNTDDDCLTFDWGEAFTKKQDLCRTGILAFPAELEAYHKRNLQSSLSGLLKFVYSSLDNHISLEAIPDGQFNDSIYAGVAGSVTVGALINKGQLYVANTGDCRAVLGSRSAVDKSWHCCVLSEDHTAAHCGEVERLERLHPDEKSSLISAERLLGQLMPLRSFGDVQYKWSTELHRNVLDRLFGRAVVSPSIYRTPPYLTAEPDVFERRISMDDRFVILATDGLWDFVKNEQAVGIVGNYLDSVERGDIPEENSATQLMRAALGRGDENTLAGMLTLAPSVKRHYHDDITVTVVFLNKEAVVEENVKSKM